MLKSEVQTNAMKFRAKMGHHFPKWLGDQYLRLCRLYMAHSLYIPLIADEMQSGQESIYADKRHCVPRTPFS